MLLRSRILAPLVAAAAFTAALRATTAEETGWNQFRGPTDDGRAAATALPLSWSETEHVRWKTAIPGKAWASPVVVADRIWLANATEDGRRLSAICLAADSGRILHDLTMFEIAEPAFCHPYNSYASPTPMAVAGPGAPHEDPPLPDRHGAAMRPRPAVGGHRLDHPGPLPPAASRAARSPSGRPARGPR